MVQSSYTVSPKVSELYREGPKPNFNYFYYNPVKGTQFFEDFMLNDAPVVFGGRRLLLSAETPNDNGTLWKLSISLTVTMPSPGSTFNLNTVTLSDDAKASYGSYQSVATFTPQVDLVKGLQSLFETSLDLAKFSNPIVNVGLTAGFSAVFNSATFTFHFNHNPTGSPTINSPVTDKYGVGMSLTADTSAISDDDGMPEANQFSYQWYASGSLIVGATSSKYTIKAEDIGKDITVTLKYTDKGGYDETVTSDTVKASKNELASIKGDTSKSLLKTDNSVSGALVVTDADFGEAGLQKTTGKADYGTFTYGPEKIGVAAKEAVPLPVSAKWGWTYTLDTTNAKVQALTGGKSLVDKLILTSIDGSAQQEITVTINGFDPPAVNDPGPTNASTNAPTPTVNTTAVSTILVSLAETDRGPWVLARYTDYLSGKMNVADFVASVTPDLDQSLFPSLIMYNFLFGKSPSQEQAISLADFNNEQYSAYAKMKVPDPNLGVYEALGRGLSSNNAFTYKTGTDTSFITKAYQDVFGRSSTPDQSKHFQDQLTYFQTMYTGAGMGEAEANLSARGAVFGQMVGVSMLNEPELHKGDDQAKAFLSLFVQGQTAFGEIVPFI